MRTIWKYPLDLSGRDFDHELCRYASIVAVDMDPQKVACLWATVNLDDDGECREKVMARFRIVGTGQPWPCYYSHVGSFGEGRFIWHLLRGKGE